ncbi:MAG TPA: helix-turn-helix domain-containing protein [Candidatus Cybelea sp.]|nr:helix-turn-helix domain-containing protein [Candidatus Cybelea sp.]
MELEDREGSSPGFGALLRSYRLAAELSQEALAERARISVSAVSALERGYRRTPQRETLTLLADALGLNRERRSTFEAAAVRPTPPRRGGSVTVGPWQRPSVAALPFALTSFIGRDAEVREIAALLRDRRLVTITGSGGVGKTQAALHVAASVSESLDCSVGFITLAPLSDPSVVTAAIALALGVQEVQRHSLIETLLAYLKNKSVLLILDNCEHVITEAAHVSAKILSNCPSVRILATSREPLKAAGEFRYRLPSLRLPSSEEIPHLAASDAAAYGAVALFADRARAVDHRFILYDGNAPAIAAICLRLDGIPLAIELAAARVTMLPLASLAAKLDNSLQMLAGGDRAAPLRHQTMRAAIDWSYELLSDREQRVFERLSIFAGGCILNTATAVCADSEISEDQVLDALSSLVDKSLVVANLDEPETRYRLLEPFAQFATEKLVDRGERDRIAERHALESLELACTLDRACWSEPEGVWYRLWRADLDNWRAALTWTLAHGNAVALGQELTGRLSVLWQPRAEEGRHWLAMAFRLTGVSTPVRVLAAMNYAGATVAAQFREYQSELAHADRAAEFYRQEADTLGVARAQSLAGHALLSLRRIPEARALLSESLAVARKSNQVGLIAYVLRCLAHAFAIEGNIDRARLLIAEAISIYKQNGSEFEASWTTAELGEAEFLAGNSALAIERASEVLEACRRFGDLRIVLVLNNLAGYLISCGRYDEACVYAREALALAAEQQRDVVKYFALQHLAAASTLKARSNPDRAPRMHPQAEVFGFVTARLKEIGSARLFVEQQEYHRVLSVLRESIGEDQLTSLLSRGATLSESEAQSRALM